MTREQEFLTKLQELVRQGRDNEGIVTEEMLQDAFSSFALKKEEEEKVREYLQSSRIGIGEAVISDDVLTEEEHSYLDDYAEMLDSLEKLTDGELTALKLSAMAGEEDAQKRLAEVMLPKVLDIAHLYTGQGVLLEDLIGGGNEALVRAVRLLAPLESPEEAEGVIGKYVMDAMEDLIAENLDEKAKGQSVAAQVNRVADKARELAEELGRKVTASELAGEGELTLEEILEAMQMSGFKIEDLEEG